MAEVNYTMTMPDFYVPMSEEEITIQGGAGAVHGLSTSSYPSTTSEDQSTGEIVSAAVQIAMGAITALVSCATMGPVGLLMGLAPVASGIISLLTDKSTKENVTSNNTLACI